MVARIWHGFTTETKSDAFVEQLIRTGVNQCRATPGNRGVYVLRRDAADRAEFVFISLWESLDAIRRFAGDDPERARYYPEDRDFLLFLEPTVTHYTVAASLP